jgi:small subunit ribosomal protein S6
VSFYETVFIARQDLTPAQADSLIETFEKVITDQGGTVPKKESWGLRSMAYKIKKNRKGHYALMNIDATGPAIQEMERQMHLHEDVLRHLVTRVDEFEDGPSAVLRAKERGDDRGRRGDHNGDRGFSKSDHKPKVEANADAPKADDAKADNAKADDAKTDDAKADDVKADDAKTDDAKADDVKADDVKAGDAKADDAKADADKAEDTGTKDEGDEK